MCFSVKTLIFILKSYKGRVKQIDLPREKYDKLRPREWVNAINKSFAAKCRRIFSPDNFLLAKTINTTWLKRTKMIVRCYCKKKNIIFTHSRVYMLIKHFKN